MTILTDKLAVFNVQLKKAAATAFYHMPNRQRRFRSILRSFKSRLTPRRHWRLYRPRSRLV